MDPDPGFFPGWGGGEEPKAMWVGVIRSPCHRMHLCRLCLRAKQGTITIRASHAEQNHDQPNNLSWVYQPHHAMPGHIVTHPDCSDRQEEGIPRNPLLVKFNPDQTRLLLLQRLVGVYTGKEAY